MASDKAYLDYILEQLSESEGISYRPMMGEYVLYVHGKVIGGVYDDRLLVKPTRSAAAMMPNACRELPYPGAKAMLLVENVDDKAFLRDLAEAVYKDLPVKK